VKRFKNILAYIDADADRPRFLDRAVELAEENGASLTLAAAVQRPSALTERLFPDVAGRWYSNVVDDARAKLAGMTARYRDERTIAVKTLVGRPWIEIIREVLRSGHDLVIKDTEAATGFSPSLDMKLLRKCPCPVWLVKRSAPRYRRIAAAIDVPVEDDGRNMLNTKIIELAHSLAVLEECELHVVRAWSVYAESVLRFKLSDEELEQLKRVQREDSTRALNEFLSRFDLGGVELHVHVLEGDAERVIPAIVAHEHEDLLVMGTIARTGVAGLVIGNTAEMILNGIKCSVLAVKPDGFVSSVRLEDQET
jgi:nucleotide-binding universal stress UspA family protein